MNSLQLLLELLLRSFRLLLEFVSFFFQLAQLFPECFDIFNFTVLHLSGKLLCLNDYVRKIQQVGLPLAAEGQRLVAIALFVEMLAGVILVDGRYESIFLSRGSGSLKVDRRQALGWISFRPIHAITVVTHLF